MFKESTICVVGLGLMGGSLALALRRDEGAGRARLIAVNRGEETLAAALAAEAIDEGFTRLEDGVPQADIIILATPVRTILRLLPLIGRLARPGTLVIDLGSSKAQVCAEMDRLPDHVQPVGGHPLCGKELAGFAAADADLYRGRPFVLCPLPRTGREAVRQAEAVACAIGARPVHLDPFTHDRAVAAISHLPYAVAASLVRAVDDAGDQAAWDLAASGFRDTSRVAASDVDMMLDVLLTNRAAVLDWIELFAGQLARLRNLLDRDDEAALREFLSAARARRNAAAKTAGW